nr:MAG: hypothetical protein [Molluscum contagiosum virus]
MPRTLTTFFLVKSERILTLKIGYLPSKWDRIVLASAHTGHRGLPSSSSTSFI